MMRRILEQRVLLIEGMILVLFLSVIILISKYGPQPLGLPKALEELEIQLEHPEEFPSRKERIKRFLGSLGTYSSAAFVLLQASQVVASPIPGEVLGLLGGYVYGKNFGFLLSTLGLALGSWLAFELASVLGRPFVERWVKKEIQKKFDFMTTNTGALVCFLLFLLPGPKDYLCYLLGLTRMRVTTFLFVVVVARMPGTYLLSLQGAAVGNESYFEAILLAFLGAVLIVTAYLFRARVLHWLKARLADSEQG